jgi:hypothetical protein
MKKVWTILTLAAAMATTPASAATFDLFKDFGSSVFSYGSRAADGTFTSFAASNCGNVGISQACYRGSDTYQLVAQRPGPQILVHPGPGAGQNTAVRFTAPKTSTYSVKVKFDRGDFGDGVGVGFFDEFGATTPVTVDRANPTFGAAFNLVLAAGESVGFLVDRGPNDYYGDTTFVAGSVAAVPESATWMMMILGFGAIGYAMRRSRRGQVTFGTGLKRLAVAN